MKHADTIEIPVRGMDCADCVSTVQRAISAVTGVERVEVYLASEKAVIQTGHSPLDRAAVRRAVEGAGYEVPSQDHTEGTAAELQHINRWAMSVLGAIFLAVLLVAVLGEGLGLIESLGSRIPWPLWLAGVLLGGFPIFRDVIRAALRGQILAHSLMSVGALAAVVAGEWPTAAVVVFFMRVGAFVEGFTTDRSRRAVRDLRGLAPQTARVDRGDGEVEIPLAELRPGDLVIVRPGESIPVDGEVMDGRATTDQASITGESLPVEVGPGSQVYAATIAQLGALRVRADRIGPESTFGQVIRLVEEAEGNRSHVERLADRFSGYYLPIVLAVALLTYVLSRNALASVAVLVVACSCSIALATPVAMLASIGAGARRGLLIKGGQVLERLAQADVLLIDKTGTVTLGRPEITDVIPLNGARDEEVILLAASTERHSEHPLAEAVREAARQRKLETIEPAEFESQPGRGVRARIGSDWITIGSSSTVQTELTLPADLLTKGRTLLYVSRNDELIGVLAAADSRRQEVPRTIGELRALGLARIEILTGDHEDATRPLAEKLGVPYRAGLLPQDKIEIVRSLQESGHVVVMVGDGVNDAPALAQADVGIAMGVAGTDIAIESADIALMIDDWDLVPQVVRMARRTMGIVRGNLAFTAAYNLIGLSLAAIGLLPPVLAAAAQSLPDLGIMANSSRLLRQR